MLVAPRRYVYLGTGISLVLLFWYTFGSPLAQATRIVSPLEPASVPPPTHSASNATLGVRIFLLLRLSICNDANWLVTL